MNMREYLFKKKLTMIAFSRQIDYNPIYFRAVIAGRISLGEKLIRAIERETKGMVLAHEIQDKEE